MQTFRTIDAPWCVVDRLSWLLSLGGKEKHLSKGTEKNGRQWSTLLTKHFHRVLLSKSLPVMPAPKCVLRPRKLFRPGILAPTFMDGDDTITIQTCFFFVLFAFARNLFIPYRPTCNLFVAIPIVAAIKLICLFFPSLPPDKNCPGHWITNITISFYCFLPCPSGVQSCCLFLKTFFHLLWYHHHPRIVLHLFLRFFFSFFFFFFSTSISPFFYVSFSVFFSVFAFVFVFVLTFGSGEEVVVLDFQMLNQWVKSRRVGIPRWGARGCKAGRWRAGGCRARGWKAGGCKVGRRRAGEYRAGECRARGCRAGGCKPLHQTGASKTGAAWCCW